METSIKQRYVCGFVFNATWERVLLINKERPPWQKGKRNGIGGKIETGEESHDAMKRECREETGLRIPHWSYLTSLEGDDWHVDFWYARTAFFDDAMSLTDEKIEDFDVLHLPENVIPNLRGLIPWALREVKESGGVSTNN